MFFLLGVWRENCMWCFYDGTTNNSAYVLLVFLIFSVIGLRLGKPLSLKKFFYQRNIDTGIKITILTLPVSFQIENKKFLFSIISKLSQIFAPRFHYLANSCYLVQNSWLVLSRNSGKSLFDNLNSSVWYINCSTLSNFMGILEEKFLCCFFGSFSSNFSLSILKHLWQKMGTKFG